MVLRLKLNDYNKMFPNASISVISFMLCENLLNKFNEAQDQALNVLL